MGEVYRARDTRLGREVALKVLPESFSRDADRLRRFEQEARAVAALSHPNILAIHDIGEQDGSPFIVSELLEGSSLRVELDSGLLRSARLRIMRRRSRKDWLRLTTRTSSIATSSRKMFLSPAMGE